VGSEDDRLAIIRPELDAIVASDGPFDEVAARILQTVCEGLGWDVGIVWKFDEAASVLRWVASWHDPTNSVTEIEKVSERSTFSPGVGLPGRVLSAQEPWWISDVQKASGFPRWRAAMEDGIHSAFGVPLLHGRKAMGILELFSREARDSDRELLISMALVGAQLGSLMEGERQP
jgi:signal transduction protein with GAF and PtsI domain